MGLDFALYRSDASSRPSEERVLDILSVSVRRNAEDGLTGFLHVDGPHFLQYLEGPRVPLARRIARIQKDRRHRNFLILATGSIDERFFPFWDMGQIEAAHLPADGLLGAQSWRDPVPDIDPLPLIEAFAAHAGVVQGMRITGDE